MRRFDKNENIKKANLLAEQRHLQSKGLISENDSEDTELESRRQEYDMNPEIEPDDLNRLDYNDDEIDENKINESSSNLLTYLQNLASKKIHGQKESLSKNPDVLANEIKNLFDSYFIPTQAKTLKDGTYWYIKTTPEPFLLVTGHASVKGFIANIIIINELVKIDGYLKYQEIYDEVMKAYLADTRLTTFPFAKFDKLPKQLNPSELGISQQPAAQK